MHEEQNFCANCGAKVIRNRLSPRILAEQVNREILAIDNRLFRTFYALFVAPQDVILGYIGGVRRKYQEVLHYFAIALTLAGFQIFVMKMFFPEVFEYDPTVFGALGDKKAFKENPFLNMDADQTNNFQAIIYMITLPLSALATYFSYALVGDKRFNLTEHFVINIYYLSQIIIVNAILYIILLMFGFNAVAISAAIAIPTYFYNFYILWRVFDDSILVSLGKYLIVLVANGILILIIMILVVAAGVIYALIKRGVI